MARGGWLGDMGVIYKQLPHALFFCHDYGKSGTGCLATCSTHLYTHTHINTIVHVSVWPF